MKAIFDGTAPRERRPMSHKEKGSQMLDSCEVAVIGAGISGLTAAYKLGDLDVVVIEADDVIGGRSRRTDLVGWPTTTGGEGWYDPNPDSPESRLLAELGIKTVPAPGDAMLHTSAGHNVTLSTPEQLAEDLSMSEQARGDFYKTFKRVAETLDALNRPQTDGLISDLLGVTGIEWIGPVHSEVLDYYRRLAAVEMGVSLETDSAFSMITGMPIFAGASVAWGEPLVPEGGAPMISQAIAERLRRSPLTGALVASVQSDDSGVTITYQHEGRRKTLHAEHVVMATPNPITAEVVRGLSSAKLAAMENVRVLPIVEVLLLLEDGGTAPWDEFAVVWTVDKNFSVGLNSRTHIGVQTAESSKHSVIKMIAVGPSAAPLADRSDACVAQMLIDDFVDMYPTARDKIRAHSIKRWTHGIAAPAFGFDQHIVEMIEPVNGIHFAGDWCGFGDTANPGGIGVDGSWGGYGISGGLHPGVRAGLRAASEIRAQMADGSVGHV